MGLFDFIKRKDIGQQNISTWIDDVLRQDVPNEVVAFCFNLYDDGENNWSMELVGTQSFNTEDEDWACDEITNFGTREKPYRWNEDSGWENVLDKMILGVREYLEKGEYATVLKSREGVGIGFVDGNIEVVYGRD